MYGLRRCIKLNKIDPVRIHPTIPAMRIFISMDERENVPNEAISIGRLPREAPTEILMMVIIGFGILLVESFFRMKSLRQSIPKVAQNESQKATSYTGASGEMIVRMRSASPKIDILDPWLPYSAKRYERIPIITARATATSHHTRLA